MRCKRTVTRIGVQLPRWFQVEREVSVGVDGRKASTLIVAQSGQHNTSIYIRRMVWGWILSPLDARRIHGLKYLYQIVRTLPTMALVALK
jgi:hypothetical protein